MKQSLNDESNSGSGFLLELEQGRRNTMDEGDQNVFQRALLRVSNRFRKHKRQRAATLGTQKPRRERLKELNQPSSSKGNGSMADHVDGRPSQDETAATIEQLPRDIETKHNPMAYKPRSNSHGHFTSESTRQQSRAKAIKKPDPLEARPGTSAQIAAAKSVSPVKRPSSSTLTTRALKSSVGSASGLSTGSRGVSMCSDVFDDDNNESSRQGKSNGPPVAPPRSPISLGIFEFPPETSESSAKEENVEEREYLNKKDLENIAMMRRTANETESSNVLLRKKAVETSLLEEIDREIKRRTRDGESNENSVSSPLSVDMPYQFEANAFDNDDSSEAYVMLRTDTSLEIGNTQNGFKPENQENRKEGYMLSNGNHNPANDTDTNVDPGVHSPNYFSTVSSQEYQNVSEVITENGVDAPPKGRRNSSRRSSSKHLSDPVVLERFAAAQQHFQDPIVTGSLREINYVNVKGKDEVADDGVTYVNVAGGGPAGRKLRKGKKPQPLNLNRSQIHWDKYDDDDSIYHDVGPLMGNGKSGSSDGLGSYKNINVGSYENVSGRGSRDRAYVNVASPTHKKPGTMLNYVLVSGKTGPKGAKNRTGSLNSVNSSKSDYSMIDERATSLLQKTREQHWQRREEDGQAQLNTPRKSKKSLGD